VVTDFVDGKQKRKKARKARRQTNLYGLGHGLLMWNRWWWEPAFDNRGKILEDFLNNFFHY